MAPRQPPAMSTGIFLVGLSDHHCVAVTDLALGVQANVVNLDVMTKATFLFRAGHARLLMSWMPKWQNIGRKTRETLLQLVE